MGILYEKGFIKIGETEEGKVIMTPYISENPPISSDFFYREIIVR